MKTLWVVVWMPFAVLFQLATLAGNAAKVLFSEPRLPRRASVAGSSLTIAVKRSLLRLLGLKRRNERWLGYHVHFFEYAEFAGQFVDFFVERWLYFKSTTSKPVIIDCGSHIGMSVLFFKYLYPDAKVVSFEPDERAFEILKNNVQANHLNDVEVVRAALYDRDGEITFYGPADRSTSVGSSIFEEQIGLHDHQVRVVNVPCRRLSPYLDQPVDFLKMNIEGAEYTVIREIAPHLKNVKEMLISSHVSSRDDAAKLRQMLGLLDEHGFSYTLVGYTPSPLSVAKGKPYLNYVHAWRDSRLWPGTS